MKAKTKLSRDYSNFSEIKFNTELSQLDLSTTISRTNDLNKSFSIFYNKLQKLINKHAPLKPVSKRKSKQLSKPWITRGLRKSIKTKNALFYSGDISMYKYYRNKISLLTRLSKKAYYTKYFEDNLFNTKKTWEGINNLINRKRKSSKHITSLRCPKRNILSSNTSEFPNIFNKHFSSVGHELASKMPNSSTSFHEYLSNSTNPFSFAFNYVSPKELELEIMSIPLNKSYGLYSCPARILKCSRYILSNPLSVLINKSVESGIYPDKLKHAKVIPIFKNDDETDPSNYRPICFYQFSIGSLKKLCISVLKIFLRNIICYMKINMAFAKNVQPNMP